MGNWAIRQAGDRCSAAKGNHSRRPEAQTGISGSHSAEAVQIHHSACGRVQRRKMLQPLLLRVPCRAKGMEVPVVLLFQASGAQR